MLTLVSTYRAASLIEDEDGEGSAIDAVATPNKCESGKENQSRNTNSINNFSPDDVDLAFAVMRRTTLRRTSGFG